MSIQAINAQSLKPAVSFKAETKTKPEQAEKPASSVSKKVAWTAAGAVALAGATFAAIKMAKGKGSVKPVFSEVKQNILDKIKAEVPHTAESLKKQSQEAQNLRFKNDAAQIVEKFEEMNKKSKMRGLQQALYNKMDWDMAPISRAEALAKKA